MFLKNLRIFSKFIMWCVIEKEIMTLERGKKKVAC